ncbi:hypothetical protein F2Q68_00027440 [Brassica cretica]|uniref:Uncharacterized protein n=1 Tax=Brassica cretica TaxID=69181 RepID=A0A8S9ID65_BRACR|nr:hypothetical protein F2Q68_00027440 [Brassica cretica]
MTAFLHLSNKLAEKGHARDRFLAPQESSRPEIIDGKEMSAEELAKPPLGYPSSKVVLPVHEAKASYGGDMRALVLSSMGKLLQ